MTPSRSDTRSRIAVVAASFAVIVAGTAAFFWLSIKPVKDAADGRLSRESQISSIAPAPIPTGVPFVGADGNDADGYPTKTIDGAGLRSLLAHERFDDVTRAFEVAQDAFEADPTRETWIHDAARAFGTPEPELRAPLETWLAKSNGHWAAHLALGSHWWSVAVTRRGEKFAKDTPAQDFAAMDDGFAHATPELEKALSLRPKLVTAIRLEILMYRQRSGRADERRLLDAGLAICPSCFQLRAAYLGGLEPRWGGSYILMDAFAREAKDPARPRLRLLAGYADLDRAKDLRFDKHYDEALATIQRACALGDYWEFLFERAVIQDRRDDVPNALADVDRAIALRPGVAEVMAERAHILFKQSDYDGATRQLIDALRLDPTDEDARHLFPLVVKGMSHIAWDAFQAGKQDEALRLLDLGADLAPLDRDIDHRRTWILTGAGTHPDVAALQRAAAAAPDDIRAHQRVDYTLSMAKDFEPVLAMWSEYLGRHPEDARAHLERAGTYRALGRPYDGVADARFACDHGISEGCVRGFSMIDGR